MQRLLSIAFALAIALSVVASPAAAGGATKTPDAIWADGTLYATVATPTALPLKGDFDNLFNFGGSGLSGQRSVSESKPGDQDFNGGRWAVYPVTFTSLGMSVYDPDGDGVVNSQFTSYEAVLAAANLGYVTIGQTAIAHFVCTVNPQPRN